MLTDRVATVDVRALADEFWQHTVERFARAVVNVSTGRNTALDLAVFSVFGLLCLALVFVVVRGLRHAYNAVIPFLCTVALTMFYAGLEALVNLSWMACLAAIASAIWCFVLTVLLVATKQVVSAVTLKDAVVHASAFFWSAVAMIAGLFY